MPLFLCIVMAIALNTFLTNEKLFSLEGKKGKERRKRSTETEM